jgi:hypothetical protein
MRSRDFRIERKALFGLFGLSAVVALSSSAIGADQSALIKMLSDPTEQQQVLSAARRSIPLVQNPCPSAVFSIERRFVIYKQPTFDNSGTLGDGSWKQIVDEQGCGEHHTLNVWVSAQGPTNVSMVPLLPGSTHADPLLQKDAVQFAAQAAATVPGGREPNCKIGYVADTEFIEQESVTLEGAKGPSWRELWTLVSCTQKMLVPIHFIPDSTGTTISAGPSSAIRVVPLKK